MNTIHFITHHSSLITRFLAVIPIGLSCQNAFGQNLSEKPNVVLILADDIGYGDLSCNGAKTIKTPNVEKLARQGVRFTNMHSSAATCTPSRYSMLTGEYAWRKDNTGIATGDAGSIIRPERYTLADVFKQSGYQTGVIGKWHLGLGDKTGTQDWNGHITPGPSDIGFDYSYIMAATGDRVPCVFVENGHVVNLDPKDPIAVSYVKNFEGEPTGKLNPELLRLHPSHGHDMSIVNGISRIGFMKGGKSALWNDEEISTVITSKAVSFIEKNKNSPFFLYFATQDAHVPRVPNPRFVGKSGMGPRGDALLEFDWSVGEIMNTLEKLGLQKKTIILLTSDNGPVVDDGYKDQAVELLGNHKPAGDYRGGKYSSFEGGTRVPAILSYPGSVKSGISDKLLCQIDFLSSFAKMLKIKSPSGAAPDSEDHLEELLNKGGNGRDYLVLQNVNNNLSIEDGKWKYIAPGKGPAINRPTNTELGNSDKDQLYDLSVDPGEKINVADKNSRTLENLRSRLLSVKNRN
jgi:arylsulfatase A-like enzyme